MCGRKAAPSRATSRVKAAVVSLRAATAALQSAAQERQRLKRVDLRPHDRRFDSAWIALRMRLEGMARLSRTPDGESASALLETLLPRGTTFVTGSVEAQWVQSATLLARVDEENHAKAIDALAGAPFLAEVRSAHSALGEALGLGERRTETVNPRIIEDSLTTLAGAIANYGRAFAGVVDEGDKESVSKFLSAMAPLDTYRSLNQVRRVDTAVAPEPPDDDVTPESPIPDVEITPEA